MLVLTLEYEYCCLICLRDLCCILFQRVYGVCEMFLMQCSFHISYACDSELVSNQKLFPTVLYTISNSLQNILSSLLHGAMLCS